MEEIRPKKKTIYNNGKQNTTPPVFLESNSFARLLRWGRSQRKLSASIRVHAGSNLLTENYKIAFEEYTVRVSNSQVIDQMFYNEEAIYWTIHTLHHHGKNSKKSLYCSKAFIQNVQDLSQGSQGKRTRPTASQLLHHTSQRVWHAPDLLCYGRTEKGLQICPVLRSDLFFHPAHRVGWNSLRSSYFLTPVLFSSILKRSWSQILGLLGKIKS